MTGNHNIKIRRESKKQTYKIDWQGHIGEIERPVEYHAGFHAKIVGAEFDGILFPIGTTENEALEQMTHYVFRPEKYRFTKRKASVAMLPPKEAK